MMLIIIQSGSQLVRTFFKGYKQSKEQQEKIGDVNNSQGMQQNTL
jgi:hypothetical protein